MLPVVGKSWRSNTMNAAGQRQSARLHQLRLLWRQQRRQLRRHQLGCLAARHVCARDKLHMLLRLKWPIKATCRRGTAEAWQCGAVFQDEGQTSSYKFEAERTCHLLPAGPGLQRQALPCLQELHDPGARQYEEAFILRWDVQNKGSLP